MSCLLCRPKKNQHETGVFDYNIISIQPIEAPMPAFDKDKLIMAKIDGVGAKVNVSITVYIDDNLTCNGLVRKSEF